MSTKIPTPSRKKHVLEKHYQHFPIPVESETGVSTMGAGWHFYKAIYRDGAVIVPDLDHSIQLRQKGGYGEPELSTGGFHYASSSDIISEDRLQRKEIWARDAEKITSPNSTKYKENKIRFQKNKSKYQIASSHSEMESHKILVINSHTNTSGVVRQVNDPFPIKERMVLMPEEALYLAYALGCLVMEDEHGRECNIDDMWDLFCKQYKNFFYTYATYHYYRSKGWVVKSGTKFAVDWVLYPLGPVQYHSLFLVSIRVSWEDTQEMDATDFDLPVTKFAMLERLSSQVNKSVLLCDILKPRNFTPEKMHNINSLKCIEILSTYVARKTPGEAVNDT